MDVTNTTFGVSFRELLTKDSEIFNTIKQLDMPQASARELFESMDICAKLLIENKKIKNIFPKEEWNEESLQGTADLLYEIFDEEFLHMQGYHRDICSWLIHKLISSLTKQAIAGRAKLRESIKSFFDPQGLKSPPSVGTPNAVNFDRPISSSRTAESYPGTPNLSPNTTANSATTIQTLWKSSGLQSFNGSEDPYRYLIWKTELLDFMNSTRGLEHWNRIDIFLHAVTGPTLLELRSLIRHEGLYFTSPAACEERLFAYLNKFDDIFARRFVEASYTNLFQRAEESCASYLQRYERAAHIYQLVKSIQMSDIEHIARFSNGLNASFLNARCMADALRTTSFPEYARALVSYSFMKFPTGRQQGQAISMNAMCYRCKADGHTAVSCEAPFKLPDNACSKCGSTKHVRAKCPKKQTLRCRRCSGDHFESACPSGVRNHSISTDPEGGMYDRLVNDDEEYALMSQDTPEVETDCTTSVYNNAICARMHVSKTDEDVISTENPMVALKIGDQDFTALLDYGACGNFAEPGTVKRLMQHGIVTKDAIHKIRPITIVYGNGANTTCNCYAVIPCRIIHDNFTGITELKFLITEKCQPELILGRTGLKQMGYNLVHNSSGTYKTSVSNAERLVLVEDVQTQHGLRIRARVHYMENALVSPFFESKRRRSLTDQRLIYACLQHMVSLGQAIEVPVEKCHCILEVVLVDKQKDTGEPRIFPCDKADITKRYRLTLDSRPLNKMRIQPINGILHFVPQESTEEEPVIGDAQKQYQLGALELLRTTNLTSKKWFVKIDFSNAYNSITTSEELGKFMNVHAIAEDGNSRYFSWRCLPQGFRLSPLLFNHSMRYILNKLNISSVLWVYFQDDLILGGNTFEDTAEGLKRIIKHFEAYGFRVNKDKISEVSNHVIFCGYKLSHLAVIPAAKDLYQDTGFMAIWSEFLKAYDDDDTTSMLKWLRSQLGRIQYCSQWFSPENQILLSKQYRHIKLLQDPKFTMQMVTRELLEEIQSSFRTLLRASGESISPLYTRSVDVKSFKGTLIVTDANKYAWCGTVFRILDRAQSLEDISSFTKDEPEDWIKILNDQIHLPSYGLSASCKLVPICYHGKCWNPSESKKSSTHLERLAQLYTVDRSREFLYHPVILVNDNQNTVKTWRNVEDTFGAEELTLFQYMLSQVSISVWFPRLTDVCKIVDTGARLIEEEGKHSQQTSYCTSIDTSGSDSEPDVSSEIEDDSLIPALVELEGPRALPSTRYDRFDRNILKDVITAYAADETTIYCNVLIKDIYGFLKDENGSYGSDVKQLATRFQIHSNGLLTYDNQRQRIVIPRGSTTQFMKRKHIQLRSLVMYLYHDMTCHLGIGKLLRKLSQLYWWPYMAHDIQRYVASCRTCCFNKGSPDKSMIMGSTIIGSQPFDVIVIDYAVVHNTPVLVIVDSFSNYVHFCESADQTAKSTATILWRDIVCVYGNPSLIHSDLGTSFINEVISELKKILRIDKFLKVNPYSPRTQGLVERYVGILKSMLQNLESFESDNFALHLKFVQFICNTTQSPTSTIPFELVFQRVAPDMWAWDWSRKQTTFWPVEDMNDIMFATRTMLQEATRDKALASGNQTFKSGDLVVRYIRMFKKNVPHPRKVLRLTEPAGRGQWLASSEHGEVFTVPEYQLTRFEYADDLRKDLPQESVSEAILFHPLRINDLLIVEGLSPDQTEWTYFVARLHAFSSEDNLLICSKFWWTKFGTSFMWKEFPDDQRHRIKPERVIANRFSLKNGKIPQKLLNRLSLP